MQSLSGKAHYLYRHLRFTIITTCSGDIQDCAENWSVFFLSVNLKEVTTQTEHWSLFSQTRQMKQSFK